MRSLPLPSGPRRSRSPVGGRREAGRRLRRSAAVLGALLGAAVLCATTMLAAPAATLAPQADTVGNATHFDGLGQPYGGCGVPQSELGTPDFVALNVFNTPGDYASYPRPVPAGQAARMGAWENGRNCGRWVKVSIGDYCTGTNDGAPGQPFCRNGSWTADAYNGATLTMLVADSCADANAWCRDDPGHLDLATSSLGRFARGGVPVTGLADHWNNRHVAWSYVPAPDYTGDIRIGFLQGAQRWWPAISVAHLPNGVHGVEYLADGGWHDAQMDSDMGQAFVLAPSTSGGTDFTVRVKDASDAYLFGGRTYHFTLPASCASTCSGAFTAVAYTTQDGTTPPPTTTPTTPPTATPTTTPPTTPTVAPTTPPAPGCQAMLAVTNQWPGGFQAEVKVLNPSGSRAISGWSVGLPLPAGMTLGQVWNAAVDTGGPPLTLRNASYNGSLAPAASTTFGMTLNGSAAGLPALTCAATT
ncbi:cellulose binding domain-containing protein [Streptomyces polygonati]|uniref:Cellulose binding domain-containing protein n=1 Tax=Streptomyces polygonati TaxID=1617087 RepID=A0ABV8HQZ1_9ACTN